MKYTGRLCTMMLLLIIEPIYIIYYYNKLGYIDIVEKIIIPIVILIAWFLGKQFDKNQFYSQELKKSKEQLRQIFNSVDAALWSYDKYTNSVIVSEGIEKIYGIPKEEFLDNPMIWQEMSHPEDIELVNEFVEQLRSGKPSYLLYRIVKDDGEVCWVKCNATPILDFYGKLITISGVAFDITEQKLAVKKYKKLQEGYRNQIEICPIGMAIHQHEKLVYINSTGAKILGNTPENIISKSIFDIVHPEFHQNTISRLSKLKKDKLNTKLEQFKLYRLDGTIVDVEMISTNSTYFDKPAVMAMFFDITDKKKADDEIKKLAYYDTLTGLPNRNMLNEYFNNLLLSSKSKKQEISIMFLDLDRFKMINDTKGHAFGDMVLQQFSKRLSKYIHEDDMICRYGGDEFIILLKDTNKTETTKVAQKIIGEFAYPFIINEEKIYSSVSIGISLYPQDGEDLETLVKCSDTAMFYVKEVGKNNYKFYTLNQSINVLRKMYLENELRKALNNNEFTLYYQPQFNLNTGKIVGIEALIRWKHPVLGLISPLEFIPIAEETGLIIPIGQWVIETACKQNKSWQEAGFSSIYVAVNISALQFQHENFVQTIKQVLEDTKLKPQYLELEVTESIMQNIKELTVVINELKEIGVKLSLDDFGTGYSSLNVLRQLPIDTLKIDKSFVDAIITDLNAAPIIKTIIDMGVNLKLNVIAEGIENKNQLDFLKQNKCNVGQGYFFSRPLPAEKIIYCLEVN